MSKHRAVPKIADGGLYEALGSANTVVTVTVPGTTVDRSDGTRRPVALEVYFVDVDGEPLEGRVGFDGADVSVTVDGTDENLGYHKRDRQDAYHLPSWAKVVYLASPTADAIAKGTWLYE